MCSVMSPSASPRAAVIDFLMGPVTVNGRSVLIDPTFTRAASLAEAEAEVASAQANLEDLLDGAGDAELRRARAGLRAAGRPLSRCWAAFTARITPSRSSESTPTGMLSTRLRRNSVRA